MDKVGRVSVMLCVAASLAFAALAPVEGWADDDNAFFRDTKVEGHLRLYDFARWNDERTGVDNNAFAFGGDLRLQTGAWWGFSAGLGYYTATDIGIGDATKNTVLVGQNNLNALSEAYLQYDDHYIVARGGRQLINTPWASEDMFTMIPRAFTGVAATALPLMWYRDENSEAAKVEKYEQETAYSEPLPAGRTGFAINLSTAETLNRPPAHAFAHLTVFGSYMFRYQTRFGYAQFDDSNRYLDDTDGFITFGAMYSKKYGPSSLYVQAWYYDFFDFAQLGYFETQYRREMESDRRGVLGFQVVVEGNSGSQRLGSVDAQVYGAMAGIETPHVDAYLLGDFSPVNRDNFRHGGLVHPYNDLSATLFTDTMNNGISDIGPGNAYGTKVSVRVLDKSLTFYGHYVRYMAEYGFGGAVYAIDGPFGFPKGQPVEDQAQWGYGFGAAYHFSGTLKGLHVYEHIGIENYDDSPRAFTDNRVGVVYAFSWPE